MLRQTFAFALCFISIQSFALLPRSEKHFAEATLKPSSGSTVEGALQLQLKTDRMLVHVFAKNLSPGKHAIHFHDKGDCSAKDAKSAGEHFNPDHVKHGAPNGAEHHLGDIGNLEVPKEGRVSQVFEILIPPRLAETVHWENFIGKSVIIHEGEDDFKSQPAGNSGGRLACGVLKRVQNVSE